MNWINKLERKFGKHYIKDLMIIITIGSAAFYLCAMVFGTGFLSYFNLDPGKILQGQVWRIITFLFVTPSNSVLYIFTIYFYFIAGSSLERVWGEFKFNIYYFISVICTIFVAFISYFLYKNGINLNVSNAMQYYNNLYMAATTMNLSLFLAYSKIYPDAQVLLFFIVPIKIKYLGYINWAIIALDLIKCIVNVNISGILFVLVPVVNYFIFFGKNNYREGKMKANSVIRMKDYKKKVNAGKKYYIHKCEVCGITNEEDPDMEFRYCSKCNGKHCYCANHIFNHKHVE